jgi:putative addiction module killer protein
LTECLDELRDPVTRARIVARLDRLKAGLLGDWKSIGDGVFELRIDVGPGFRVYYGQEGNVLILLLCGGDKRTQTKDIENAHTYWKDYQARKPKPTVQRRKASAKQGRGRRLH